MSFAFRRARNVVRIFPKICSATSYRFSGACTDVVSAPSTYLSCNSESETSNYRKLKLLSCLCKRYSTVAEKHEVFSAVDILSFIQFSLSESDGPSKCWINKVPDSQNWLKEDGIYLVCVVDRDLAKFFEKSKLLQRRYPFLQVLGVQYFKPEYVNDSSMHLLQKISKEYVSFPILLTTNNLKMENGPCYILSKGFQDPLVYKDNDADIMLLGEAVENLNSQRSKRASVADVTSPWMKPIESIKEPDICSALCNLLFSFPGCISADEIDNRLFLSDVNHHRIIVFNSSGKILDVIGSSPGFEDGEFENAKLMRPAASFYHAYEDCLYFVDSENHAIRKADLESRVVETVFPKTDGSKKDESLWNRFLDMIWMDRDVKQKPEETSQTLLFPWHILKSPNNNLLVLNKSFLTLWIIDLESGSIKEVVKESSKILEICGQMITEKSIPLRQIPADCLQQQIDNSFLDEEIPYASLMSSVTTFKDHIVLCDTVGHTALKFSKKSGSLNRFQFSNFGILGVPYWLSLPLERVYAVNNGMTSGIDVDHRQQFRLFPGRIDIEINIEIPQHLELVEVPQDNSIWRQARGSAAEVSGVENKAASTEKAGISQQWYDEIDNLSFTILEEETVTEEQSRLTCNKVLENKASIGCTINTSPGTSEVIIYSALYLRLKKNTSDSQEEKAARIADILDPKRRFRRYLLVKLLMKANRDLEEHIFTRPLHVRLRFNTMNHPKADNSKDIILTDSSVKVQITL